MRILSSVSRRTGSVLCVLGAVLMILVVPSTAWAATDAPLTTGSSTCGWSSDQLPMTATCAVDENAGACCFVYKKFNNDTGAFISQASYIGGPGRGFTHDATVRWRYELWTSNGGANNGTAQVYTGQRIILPKAGETMANPAPAVPTATTCGATGDFRHISTYVDAGTLDVTWKWAGTVPARGWDVTNAASTDPVGAGTVQTTVPGTELSGRPGRFGLLAYSIASGVTSLRVQQHGKAGCFFGFSVQRDAGGVVTGVTIGGAVSPDLSSDPAPATDEGGANCSMLDFVCTLKWLFVPKPSTWGFEDLRTQAQARPPVSLVLDTYTGMQAIASAFDDSCAAGNFFPIPGVGSVSVTSPNAAGNPGVDCTGNAWTHTDGAAWARRLMMLGLYVMTAFVLWGMAESAFNGGGGGDS
jgi:hypothetical protein